MSLFETIREVVPTLPGWCELDKAMTLAAIVIAHRPAVSVEIGIFGGRSFIPIALAHQANEYGTAVGIEPWDSALAVQMQTTVADQDFWANVSMTDVEQRFWKAMKSYRLESRCQIMRQTSNETNVTQPIGLLHIDGAHNLQAKTDVLRFAKQVETGGYCVLDDLEWTGGGVKEAEKLLLSMKFQKRYPLGTGAVYQRVSLI